MAQHFEIRPNRSARAGEQPFDLVRKYAPDAPNSFAWGMDQEDMDELFWILTEHQARVARERRQRRTEGS